MAAETESLRAKGEGRVKEVRRKHQQAIEKVEQEASARLKLLRQRLTDRIKTKPESAKNDFPAYKKAKSSGYKDGKEPSDYEVNNILQREIRDMMNSLDPLAKIVLQQMASALSSSEANKLLAAIMEMSPAERNRRLRSALNR